ncbi:MAG TPA: glycosyltransferase family 2 protein [Acidobacteriota bacterium]|nr:glycosyltransferase family 2 protein [Acidobacteriota bacterium]
MKLSVVIPIFNEKRTILEIVQRVRDVDLPKEIILVDDCSTDGTREILESLPPSDDLRIRLQPHNFGKGAALRAGFEHVSGDIVVVQDADLEYDPADYAELIRPILANKADVVYGSRFLSGPHRVLFFWHYVGNRILTTLSNMLTDLNLTDMETCYKVFRADLLKKIRFRENRFGFEPEFTAKVAKARCRIYEVPISYSGRDYSEGKKIGWKDGVAALFIILKYRLID